MFSVFSGGVQFSMLHSLLVAFSNSDFVVDDVVVRFGFVLQFLGCGIISLVSRWV